MGNNNTIFYKCLDCGHVFEKYDYERVFACNCCNSMNISTDVKEEESEELTTSYKY